MVPGNASSVDLSDSSWEDAVCWSTCGGLGPKYSKLFDALRFLHSTCMSESQVTHRLVYADGKIRVRWSAALWMRDPALGLTTRPFSKTGEPVLAHLDGVSVYVLDPHSALIVEHRLEHLVLNGDAAGDGSSTPEASLLEPSLAARQPAAT